MESEVEKYGGQVWKHSTGELLSAFFNDKASN